MIMFKGPTKKEKDRALKAIGTELFNLAKVAHHLDKQVYTCIATIGITLMSEAKDRGRLLPEIATFLDGIASREKRRAEKKRK